MATNEEESRSSPSSRQEDHPKPILFANEDTSPATNSSKQDSSPPISFSERKLLYLKAGKPLPFRKKMFFFYGSLMDPTTLAKVLHLKEPLSLRTAKIEGPPRRLWGPRRAFPAGPRETIVEGAVFEAQSPEQVKLLLDYGTDRYERVGCRNRLADDESVVMATTFLWRAKYGGDELKGGDFDLEAF